MDKPKIVVDWTVDPTTHCSNSSPEFNRLTSDVAQLIRRNPHDIVDGRIEKVAGLIMAQLAHKHGLAPQLVDIQSLKADKEGVLRGDFEWNGVFYRYEAKPVCR